MKLRSWLILIVLITLVAFAAGIRQGMHVERSNTTQLLKAQETVERTSQDVSDDQTTLSYAIFEDSECGVRFLLPEGVSSNSGTFGFECGTFDATRAAQLINQEYQQILTASESARLQDVWIKAEPNLFMLITETIKTIDSMDN